ncbi:DUF1697 domain-containing protein [Gordonia sp. VNK21]|uniref:DUF1697 domain-containing protein n=1 Tax=Gordonia sp. VNK21 TaxID=3382483 RepID=UPI0038D3EC33
MSTPRIHLLRAVNVGGAKLPMARLRELAAGLGATEVSTYIASGNLLCVPPGDPAAFDRALEQAVQDEFGFFREVISRSADQLAAALAAYPFAPAVSGHICFLSGVPDPDRAAEFCARDFGAGEKLAVIGADLHLDYPGGAGTTRLSAPVIAKGLGVPGTARNLRTVATLIDLARA